MCLGVEEIHRTCGHLRSKTMIEPCSVGFDRVNNFCADVTVGGMFFRQKWIVHPPLCTVCFRQAMDALVTAHDRIIIDWHRQIIETKILRARIEREHIAQLLVAESDEKLIQEEHVRHAEEYAPLMSMSYYLDEKLARAEWKKKQDLAEFLEEMGVWADG